MELHNFAPLPHSQNRADEDVTCWEKEYPVTVLQFILFLYHNQPDFAAQCASPEFLCALASTLFTYKTSSEANSEVGTPVEELKVHRPLGYGDMLAFVGGLASLIVSALGYAFIH